MAENYKMRSHKIPSHLSIVYADDRVLALSKPSGLLSVPGKAEDNKDCLETRAKNKFETARIVHRLDMETSGILIFAMDAEAHRHLGLQFERRKTSKTYIARITGNPKENSGEISLPLRCDWPNRPKQMVDHELGKHAQTFWEIIEREDNVARIKLTPVTGRSHQLRVHMQQLGHPILGDKLYAPEDVITAAPRLQLHAEKLEFHHPDDGRIISLYDPCPF
jgi:tRNA pseudouridine32 synthase/23S rRNA pseudouridine746 synthase